MKYISFIKKAALMLIAVSLSQPMLNAHNTIKFGRAALRLSQAAFIATPLAIIARNIHNNSDSDRYCREMLTYQQQNGASTYGLINDSPSKHFIRSEIVKHVPTIKYENIVIKECGPIEIGVCIFLNEKNESSVVFHASKKFLDDIADLVKAGTPNGSNCILMHEIGHIKANDIAEHKRKILSTFTAYSALLAAPQARSLFKEQAYNGVRSWTDIFKGQARTMGKSLLKKSILLQCLNVAAIGTSFLLKNAYSRYREECADGYSIKNNGPQELRASVHVMNDLVTTTIQDILKRKGYSDEFIAKFIYYSPTLDYLLYPISTHPTIAQRNKRFNKAAEQKELVQQSIPDTPIYKKE